MEVIGKIIFHHLHKRLWNHISWGKKKHLLSEIPVIRELDQKDMEIIKNRLRELGYLD